MDLLKCSEAGEFQKWADEDMSGYVWDYSAYPQCTQAVKMLTAENEIAEN